MRPSRRAVALPRRRGPGRPPGPSRRHEVHERLIVEASRLYAAGGHTGLSYGTLAERCGITKATVFHYFPSKESLVYAVFENMGRRLERAALDWFEASGESYAQRLERIVTSLVELYGEDPVNARILCQGLLDTSSGAPPPGIFGDFVARFVDFVRRGIDGGEFYPSQPLGTVLSIGGAVLFEFMLPEAGRPILRSAGGDEALAARRRDVVDFVRRAVVQVAPRRRKPSRKPSRKRATTRKSRGT